MKRLQLVQVFAVPLVAVVLAACGQSQAASPSPDTKAAGKSSASRPNEHHCIVQDSVFNVELLKEMKSGEIYEPTSKFHPVVHEFTYLIAIRVFCDNALLQMRKSGETEKELYTILQREMTRANATLALEKFFGLKTEKGLYEKYWKQFEDRFGMKVKDEIPRC